MLQRHLLYIEVIRTALKSTFYFHLSLLHRWRLIFQEQFGLLSKHSPQQGIARCQYGIRQEDVRDGNRN